jgi:hypothetical protein
MAALANSVIESLGCLKKSNKQPTAAHLTVDIYARRSESGVCKSQPGQGGESLAVANDLLPDPNATGF